MLAKDLLYAFRTLRKSPLFAITAIVTIALGIGTSTAIFTVTNTVLLHPLPYKAADRLVLACSDLRQRNVKDFPLSDADFLRSEEHTSELQSHVNLVCRLLLEIKK